MSDSQIFCPFCDTWIDRDSGTCTCGKSMKEIRREQRALNREANRRMGIDEAVIDEPWGDR